MGRLIEIQDPRKCPSPLTVQSGDVLLFRATGGRVKSPSACVQILGAFVTAVVGDNGAVFTPAGFPNTVLIAVRAAGEAEIELMSGHPFSPPPQKTEIRIFAES